MNFTPFFLTPFFNEFHPFLTWISPLFSKILLMNLTPFLKSNLNISHSPSLKKEKNLWKWWNLLLCLFKSLIWSPSMFWKRSSCQTGKLKYFVIVTVRVGVWCQWWSLSTFGTLVHRGRNCLAQTQIDITDGEILGLVESSSLSDIWVIREMW